ncbi:MAG: (2Fe-2S)-binding protein [Hahellaceae bacterium]|nr:(2Fe-2S)-binding protein [Hahellaceae bacterium]
MYVCVCKGITDQHIREEIEAGARHLKDIVNRLNLARDCAQCVEAAREIFDSAYQSFQDALCVDAMAPNPAAA